MYKPDDISAVRPLSFSFVTKDRHPGPVAAVIRILTFVTYYIPYTI